MATIRDNSLGYFELPSSTDKVFRGRTTGDSSDAWSLTSGGSLDVTAISVAGVARQDPVWDKPALFIRSNIDRMSTFTNQASALVSGRLHMCLVWYAAGDVVTSISWVSSTTAGGSLTNQWSALFSASRVKLAVSADDTSTAWGSGSGKTFTLTSPYTIPTAGLYYHGLVVVASQVPSLLGVTSSASVTGQAPIMSGYADTGLTDPASCPSTATALTAKSELPWTYSK